MADCEISAHEQRLKGIEERLRILETNNVLINYQYNQIMETIKSLKSDFEKSIEEIKSAMESIKSTPAKNWDSLVKALISGSAGAIIGFIASKIFGG